MSKLRDEFIDWQADKVGTPFVQDEEFFLNRYGALLSPFCKDLFREILETDLRLAKLEAKAAIQDAEGEEPDQCDD